MTVRDFDIFSGSKLPSNKIGSRRQPIKTPVASLHTVQQQTVIKPVLGWRVNILVCVLGWSRVEFVVFLQSRQKNKSVVNNGTQ